MPDLTIRELQKVIRRKDYYPDRPLQYLQKLVEEVGELARAMRDGTRWADTGNIKGTIDEEFYDVLYYVTALANIYGVDLQTAMELKEPLNDIKYGRVSTD